jgi:8-amino-7-oxononanoate synthase
MDFATHFQQQLKILKENNLYRYTTTNNTSQDQGGVIDFCSNDYLGLKNHPQVIEALQKAAIQYGVGSGGSHLISGHHTPHKQLEEYLATYLGVEKVLLFSSGYMANLGVFSALKDDIDWVLQDKLNHASLIDANFLIGKKIQRYIHNNINSLTYKLTKQQGMGLVATDTVFSMDGDVADIGVMNATTQEHNAIFMQDDAHGFGIYSPTIPQDSLYMATLGKAVGTYGAFVAGNTDIIDYITQKSRPYIYTTATPPALSVATLQALKLIQTAGLQEKLFENITLFKSFITTSSHTAIQPIEIPDNATALQASKYLLHNGFLVKAIRKPTVATPRLRITLSAAHTTEQITKIAELLQNFNN